MSNTYTPARTSVRLAAFAFSAALVAGFAGVLELDSGRSERFAAWSAQTPAPAVASAPVIRSAYRTASVRWHDGVWVKAKSVLTMR